MISRIHDQTVTHKLFAEIAPRYADRSGGYLRILKLGPAPRRQRAHGAYRTGVSQLSLDEPTPAPSDAQTRQLKLVVAYDGTDFHGFAAQPEQRTVEGEIAGVLERVLQHDIQLTCAGRTDTGVHAWTQVVSCAGRRSPPTRESCNGR